MVEVLDVLDPLNFDEERLLTLMTDIEAWLLLTDTDRRPFRRRLGFAR